MTTSTHKVSMSIAELRRRLRPGVSYFATWLGPIVGNRPRTTARRVTLQSRHRMESEVLDGPEPRQTIRLDWNGCTAYESGNVIIIRDDDAEFLKIDTIGE